MGKDRNTVAGEIQQALIKKLAKRLAYRFGSAAKEGAGLTARGFIDALKEKKNYDELKAYLYGPESVGMQPFLGKTSGPSHDSMVGTRGAREYHGLLNPEGEFVFPSGVQPVLESAADVGGNIYVNADLMPYTEGYRYDAANHPVRITRDSNGNLVGSAADLYDFDPGYVKRYDAPAWQVLGMAASGEPYIVRQDNIPIRFVGDDGTEEDRMKANKTMEAWGSAETPHRKQKRADLPGAVGTYDDRDSETIAIENTLLRSGMPILEPSVVTADYPHGAQYNNGGGFMRRFDGGTPGQLYYNPDFAAVDNTTPVDYVTESGPFLQLDADSLYGGEMAPAVMVADDRSKKTVSRAQHNANRRRVEEMMQDDATAASPRDVAAVKQQMVAEPQVAVDKSSVESSVMDAMVHQNYGRLKKLNKAENKESIKALQRELLAHGYDLGKSGENKDGVDGVIGPKTLRALRAYRNEKPKVEYGNVEDPLPISNAVYAVASNIPGLKYFVPNSFRGTEEEARNLGYKTYIDPVDGKRKSVNYPVTLDGNDAPTRRDIAAAQMRKYGITGDFTSDKSAYQRNNYAYLPAYGYNFLAPFYNKKENLPVADPFTGTAVRLGANRVETGAERAKDWYNKTFGKNVVYTYADASPAREDYRNLYFGYPQRNGTLMVNENVDRMNSGEFRTGYAFVPRDSNAILALANSIGNGDGVQYTSGHQLGNFGYGRNADNERWYYDDWDLIGDNTKIGFSLIGGKPFQVYDRDFKGGKKK